MALRQQEGSKNKYGQKQRRGQGLARVGATTLCAWPAGRHATLASAIYKSPSPPTCGRQQRSVWCPVAGSCISGSSSAQELKEPVSSTSPPPSSPLRHVNVAVGWISLRQRAHEAAVGGNQG